MNRWECSYNGSGGWSTSENVGLNNANIGENTMPQRRIFIYLFVLLLCFVVVVVVQRHTPPKELSRERTT